MMRRLLLLLLLFPVSIFAQQQEVFRIDSLPTKGVLLNKNWKWYAGDNPDFAKSDFNNSTWESIDPTKDIMDLPQIFDSNIKWLRLDFVVKSKFSEQIGLSISQSGASEIYLNGRLVKQIGHFDVDLNKVIANDPRAIPFYLPVDSAGKYNLAIRYVLQPNILYTKLFNTRNLFFKASFVPLVQTLNSELNNKAYRVGLDVFKFGMFLILFILHAAFYFNQKNDRAHFLLALSFLSLVTVYLLKIVVHYNSNVSDLFWYLNLNFFLFNLAFCLQLAVLYYITKVKIGFSYWALIVFGFISEFLPIFIYNYGVLSTLLFAVVELFFLLRITIIGFKKKIRGFKFLSVGIILNVLSFIFFRLIILQAFNIPYYLVELIFNVGVMAFPIGLSIYMGLEASYTNQELTEKLTENEILKEHTVKQEQEKQQILFAQNETLEKQVTERTAELNQSLNVLKSTQAQLIQSEKLASLGELTAGIAHEIQNPLNFVNNFAEVSAEMLDEMHEELEKGDTTEAIAIATDLKTNLKKINHHGQRASSIVKGMLEHSRTSTGVKEPTDLNALADEYLRLAYHGLRAKDNSFNATMETHFDPDLPHLEVVPQDIGRVILNLINNAFYAVTEKAKQGIEGYSPTVTISTRWLSTAEAENAIEISVKDNGNGIPEAIRDKIFQPFFTTKPTGQGTGLGLSLAYDIVTKGHGGTLDVSSVPNEGTEFIIQLPFMQ
jgi:signal transduction histidine kinase